MSQTLHMPLVPMTPDPTEKEKKMNIWCKDYMWNTHENSYVDQLKLTWNSIIHTSGITVYM